LSVCSSICKEVLYGLLRLILEEGEALILPQRKYINLPFWKKVSMVQCANDQIL